MRVRVNRLLVVALCAAIAVTIAFIFARSLQGSDGSWAESNAVAAMLEPVLGWLHGVYCGACGLLGFADPLDYWRFVRKVAHFAEYGLLGAECSCLAVLLAGRAASPYVWTVLFSVLMVAVLDEFLQGFVGRSSMVGDVLLDFSGALFGTVLVLAVAAVLARFRAGDR